MEVLDVRYPGGKGLAGLQQWICSLLPPHVHYVEPFAGKAGVFRGKPPSLTSTLIDRDFETVAWLRRHIKRWDQGGGGGHLRVVQGDGIEWMERAGDDDGCDPETLVYCDPPYHPSTRVRLNLYRFEMTDRDHRRFLRAATRLRCSVVISGYLCDLYADRLQGWAMQTRQVITRGRTMATECVWRNQTAAEVSAFGMSYDQLGGSFRERERVNRLVKRWEADFGRRSDTERRAILLALLNAEAKAGGHGDGSSV
jgi:DNA adenine methylase